MLPHGVVTVRKLYNIAQKTTALSRKEWKGLSSSKSKKVDVLKKVIEGRGVGGFASRLSIENLVRLT